jgi:ATP phosphoribosyltransferase
MNARKLEEGGRRLIFVNPEKGLRYFWAKPSDVSIYVERGAADLGIVGAGHPAGARPGGLRASGSGDRALPHGGRRTARLPGQHGANAAGRHKVSQYARRHYEGKSREIDIIHLNGSIELAPILGLSDVIVDIVETGKTLRENDLEIVEEIVPISARLIANRVGYRFKHARVTELCRMLSERGAE